MTATRAGWPKPARSGATEWALHADWVAGLAAWRMARLCRRRRPFRQRRRPLDRLSSSSPPAITGRRAPTPPAAVPQRVQARLADRRAAERDLLRPARPERARHSPAPCRARRLHRRGLARSVRSAQCPHRDRAHRDRRERSRRRSCSAIRPGSARRAEHEPLLHLAARLNLTGTQMWLAHNGPRGTRIDTHDRYPTPELAAGARLAGRPGPGLRPRPPGIELPPRRGEPGRRPRADAGPPRHRRRPDPLARHPRRSEPPVRSGHQHGIRPGLSRISARPARHRRPAAAGDRRLQCRPGADRRMECALRSERSSAVSSNRSLIGRRAATCRSCSATTGSTRSAPPIASPSRRALVAGLWPRFPGMQGPTAVRIEPRRSLTNAAGRD